MEKRTIRNFFFAAIILIVIAVTGGYFLWNKPHTNILEAKATETDAVILYNAFITDSTRANTTYANKVLKVSGIVKGVSINQQHQQIIFLKTQDVNASVNCTMEVNALEIRAGDTVSLKGFCIGYVAGEPDMEIPGDVFVVRCYRSK